MSQTRVSAPIGNISIGAAKLFILFTPGLTLAGLAPIVPTKATLKPLLLGVGKLNTAGI